MKSMLAVLLLTMSLSVPAVAREVAGVQVPESLTLPGLKKPLVLNGAGVRTRLTLKVYVGALYTVQPTRHADRVLNAVTPRSVRLHFLRELTAKQLADAWRSGLAANRDDFEMRALQGRLGELSLMMRDVKPNDVLRIDFLERGVTKVTFNEQLRGSIQGSDFQRALLQVWLGKSPADKSLKAGLLTGAGVK